MHLLRTKLVLIPLTQPKIFLHFPYSFRGEVGYNRFLSLSQAIQPFEQALTSLLSIRLQSI